MRVVVAFALASALLVGCGKGKQPAVSDAVQAGVHITSIKGRVRVKRAEALAWTDASLVATLQKGDLISTDGSSMATLQFTDGTLFHVRPESLITILENSRDVSLRPHVGLGIESGRVDFGTGASFGERTIETPGGRVTPGRETEGVVVARGGGAEVHIRRGEGRLETKTGERVHLGPAEGVLVDAEGRAAPGPAPTATSPARLAPPDEAGVWSGVSRPPQLALDTIELRGTQLHIAGRTEPGVTVTLNGARIPVQGDGSFNEHVVALERTAVVSVRATSPSGATTEQRLPVVASR